MRILTITSEVAQCLIDKSNPQLVDKIINLLKQFDCQKILIEMNTKKFLNLQDYGIHAEIFNISDFFHTLEQIKKCYSDIALFIIMHKNNPLLVKKYLDAKHTIKLCFLDIDTKRKDNEYEYIKISNDDCTSNTELRSTPGIYKYRNLNNPKAHLFYFKIYELPGIYIH